MNPEWQSFLEQQTVPETVLQNLTQPALTALTDRSVIEVSGPDATEFLHAQFITDIKNMTAGSTSLSSWCTPKGRSICNFIIADDGDKYTLVLPRALHQSFTQRLQMFVLRAQVTITNKLNEKVCLGLLQTQHASLQDINISIPDKNQCINQSDILSLSYLSNSSLLIADVNNAQAIWSMLSETVPACTSKQWALTEIQQHCPWLDEATSEAFIPQEMSLDEFGIMTYDKGCYPGQEIIARIHYRSEVKRRLQQAACSTNTEILPASKIINSEGNKAGTVVMAVNTDKQQQLLCVIDTQYHGNKDLMIDGIKNAVITYPDIDE